MQPATGADTFYALGWIQTAGARLTDRASLGSSGMAESSRVSRPFFTWFDEEAIVAVMTNLKASRWLSTQLAADVAAMTRAQ